MKKQQVSVSELTRSISNLLSSEIGTVCVIGEISNFVHHSSGHKYFSLKDDFAQISAVMWKSRTLNFLPKDGMKVLATGSVSVYAPRGQYQLDCISMQPLGVGDLYLAYEELKARLQDKGYFDTERKKNIPSLAMKIGVITSPTGAAVRDIKTTLNRRLPCAEIFFRPTLVQGIEAATDIVSAIRELDKLKLDLIICGRGGGSIEDLWAFNMESVADAIFKCRTPIISAVGHETDFTIADFVADLRAATPTAGAELASPNTREDIISYIESSIDNAKSNILRDIDDSKFTIDQALNSYGFRQITQQVNTNKQQIDENSQRMQKRIRTIIKQNEQLVKHNLQQLTSLYPLQPLKKGFALLKDAHGNIINSNDSLSNYSEIEIQRSLETVKAEVREIL